MSVTLAPGAVVLLFPGQGMQHLGMGRALAAEHAAARRVFEEADATLGWSLSRLCWDGPEEALTRTEHAQPAILAHAIAALRVLEERGELVVGAAAGHSLGEWSALVAAGALSLSDAVRLVHLRGRYMQEAAPSGLGGMVAVRGLELDAVHALAAEARASEVLAVATHNGPGDLVLSGHRAALARATALAMARGASGVIEVPVGTPFHCALMAPAAERLAEALTGVSFSAPAFPIRSTVVDDWISGGAGIASSLVAQLTAPVLWHEAILALAAAGASRAFALGPARPLVGMVRRIARRLAVTVVGEPDEP